MVSIEGIAAVDHVSNLIVIATIMTMGCTNAAGDSPFRITAKRHNDRIDVAVEKGKAVISVHSPFGISQAVIERADEKWSDIVMLRLHLKGLEKLKVTNGKVTIEAAVSSQDGKVRQWKDGREDSLLDFQSPYWMETRMVGRDGKRTTSIPLTDGYFEVPLPKVFFEDNPKSITVNWVDFYR